MSARSILLREALQDANVEMVRETDEHLAYRVDEVVHRKLECSGWLRTARREKLQLRKKFPKKKSVFA